MGIFQRNRLTLNRVRDTVYFREGRDEIRMVVDEDALAIGRRIRRSLEYIDEAKQDEAKIESAARQFVEAVFGADQTEKLVEFYHGDMIPAFEITSLYMTKRLAKIITKAQRNAKAF